MEGLSLDTEALRFLERLVRADLSIAEAKGASTRNEKLVGIREGLRADLARRAHRYCCRAGIEWAAFEAEVERRSKDGPT